MDALDDHADPSTHGVVSDGVVGQIAERLARFAALFGALPLYTTPAIDLAFDRFRKRGAAPPVSGAVVP